MRSKVRSSLLIASTALLLFSGLSRASAAPAASPVSPPVSIMLDGYPLPFPVAPYVTAGTTMVPFRAIAEALNIEIAWTDKTQTLTATKSEVGAAAPTTVVLHKNDKQAFVNGQQEQLRVAPTVKDGSLFIPLSFFSTAFGAEVSWDGVFQTVSITSPIEPMYSEAFYAISSYSKVGFVPNFNAVSFGWTRLDATGNLVLNGRDYYWPKPAGDVTPESIVQDAADAGDSPSLMAVATDGNGEETKLLQDPSLQTTVIEQLVSLASQNHFSGITLDFENLGLKGDVPAIRQSFTDFVQKLDQSAEAANLKLTLALHPPNSSYRGYDYEELAKYADEIIIMAYEYTYADGPEPMNRVNEAIQLALQSVPKSKLVLGISMGSENAQTVGNKIGLAKRYGLKGVAFWYLGLISDASMSAIQDSIVKR
ncbi:glycosyl hydrolase [Paenibacillus rhizovicinus]|uniref:Glycosyl hydrolase n=1 Tax=Paenibacillus rhizovicinus TaxID=2704463 RepID=A0A6C0P8S6_9BACL|nr:stalk domain-containing protein [Paenibacillus rhizovicinus]QHW34791.1 glycosyl hydrolase [Paenibacillus rhizovicinus]